MQERTLEELYKKLKKFDRLAGKEEFLLDEIRDAVEAQDLAFAAQICDFVLNDEFEKLGALWGCVAYQHCKRTHHSRHRGAKCC